MTSEESPKTEEQAREEAWAKHWYDFLAANDESRTAPQKYDWYCAWSACREHLASQRQEPTNQVIKPTNVSSSDWD